MYILHFALAVRIYCESCKCLQWEKDSRNSTIFSTYVCSYETKEGDLIGKVLRTSLKKQRIRSFLYMYEVLLSISAKEKAYKLIRQFQVTFTEQTFTAASYLPLQSVFRVSPTRPL